MSLECPLPGLSVQVAELAILGLDFRGIELRMVGEYVLPPLLLIEFLQMNENTLLVLCMIWSTLEKAHLCLLHTERPGTIIDLDLFAEFARHDGLPSIETDAQLLLLKYNAQIASTCAFLDWNSDIDIAELLRPTIG